MGIVRDTPRFTSKTRGVPNNSRHVIVRLLLLSQDIVSRFFGPHHSSEQPSHIEAPYTLHVTENNHTSTVTRNDQPSKHRCSGAIRINFMSGSKHPRAYSGHDQIL